MRVELACVAMACAAMAGVVLVSPSGPLGIHSLLHALRRFLLLRQMTLLQDAEGARLGALVVCVFCGVSTACATAEMLREISTKTFE